MQIWPAIDLRGGQCVRLQQGDYQRETVFDRDPVAVARRWVGEGAEGLHLVDLDGARSGKLMNLPTVRQIVEAVEIPCQLGGGVRDQGSLERLLDCGLARVIVGTLAARRPEWFREMAERFPQRLVLGVDARQGLVATEGWLETESLEATELARSFDDLPLAAIVYTDIGTDGMLRGPNVAAMAAMKQAVRTAVLASGGVTTAEDIDRLREVGLDGCIVGRALYEGRLTLADALQAARQEQTG